MDEDTKQSIHQLISKREATYAEQHQKQMVQIINGTTQQVGRIKAIDGRTYITSGTGQLVNPLRGIKGKANKKKNKKARRKESKNDHSKRT
jgi:hypothetical protein